MKAAFKKAPAAVRLVALDLDGTLLNTQKEITPRTLRALQQAAEQGVLPVPITGRPAQGLPAAVLELPGLRYAVTSNGATIRDLVSGEVLLEKHLQAETCLQVLQTCQHFPVIREVFRNGIGYLSQTDFERLCARYQGLAVLDYLKSTRRVLPGTVEDFLRQGGLVEELFFLTDSPETKAALHQTLAGLPHIGFADPFPNDLEVIAGDIDKGEALRYLMARLEIPSEQTVAMGDGGSDVPLLKAAGLGIAMGNAPDFVKAAADVVTTSCDEDGVALALERYVLRSNIEKRTGQKNGTDTKETNLFGD